MALGGGPHITRALSPNVTAQPVPGTQAHPCPPWVLTGCGSGPGHRLHAWHLDLQPVHRQRAGDAGTQQGRAPSRLPATQHPSVTVTQIPGSAGTR